MKRIAFLFSILLVFAGFGIFNGCGDDNSTGTQLGDTNSVTFQFIDSTLGDDIFESFLIRECKFLKIDCEGCEHEVLFHTKYLDRIANLAVEIHSNKHLANQGYSAEKL